MPKKDFLSTAVSVTTLVNTTSVYGDENYDDEDDDTENQNTVSEGNMEAPSIPALGCYTITAQLLSCLLLIHVHSAINSVS